MIVDNKFKLGQEVLVRGLDGVLAIVTAIKVHPNHISYNVSYHVDGNYKTYEYYDLELEPVKISEPTGFTKEGENNGR